MATYGDMQDRIADELRRTDLTARIKKAIVSSVDFYQRRQFYFSESSFTFVTVAHQETYTSTDAAAIATASNLERLNALINGVRTPLNKVDWLDIDDKSSLSTSYAQPEEWGYRAQSIRLYPIPDGAYTVTAYDVPRLTSLSADADTNCWTEDAEELIRCRSKRLLLESPVGITGREKEYLSWGQRETEVLNELIAETARRKGTGFSQPTRY